MIRRGVPGPRGSAGTAGDDGVRPAAGPVRRSAAPGLPGEWPTGYDDAAQPVHAGLAGADHLRAGRGRGAGRRGSSRGTPSESGGRSMISWARAPTTGSTPTRSTATFFTLTMLMRLPGGERRRLGALRRPGEGPAADRLSSSWRSALDWAASAAADDRHRVLVPAHRPVALRRTSAPDELARPLGAGRFAGQTFADVLAQAARMGWMPSLPDVRPQPARPGRRGGRRRPGARASYVVDELRAGRLRFAGEDPDAPENFPRVLTIWRANLLGSSAKGNEYFLQAPARRRRRRARRGGAAGGCGPTDVRLAGRGAHAASSTCWSPLDFRMTST